MKTILTLTLTFIWFSMFCQTASFTEISALSGVNNTGLNSGVAFGDFDNDGWEDIYVSIMGAANKLYRNNGDLTFTDVALAAGVANEGVSMLATWADIDNDGFLDLYLGNRNQANVLYLNNGNGTFSNITQDAGVGNTGQVRSINFADVDNDGWVDIYVANLAGQNVLYRNNGNLTFTNITTSSGTVDTQISMAAIFFDYDNDRDQDLYLSHDADQTFIFYENDGTGHFSNVAAQAGVDLQEQGMGLDVADFNNDGYLDIYVTNLYPNVLLLNNGNKTFTDISGFSGTGDGAMTWGTTWVDYDNDGFQDIYMVNDSYFNNSGAPDILYRNNGNLTFTEVSPGTPLASTYAGYGAACADINRDGAPDLFVANRGNDGNQLFLNNHNQHNWIAFKMIGTNSNRSGIGTRLELELGNGESYISEVKAGSGYASQSSLIQSFGLKDETIISQLTVKWPSGLTEEYHGLEANQLVTITEGQGLSTPIANPVLPITQISIFPNPVSKSENLAIEFNLDQQAKVSFTIFNPSGEKVFEFSEMEFTIGTQHVDLREALPFLSTGIYFVRIQVNGNLTVLKLFVNS